MEDYENYTPQGIWSENVDEDEMMNRKLEDYEKKIWDPESIPVSQKTYRFFMSCFDWYIEQSIKEQELLGDNIDYNRLWELSNKMDKFINIKHMYYVK